MVQRKGKGMDNGTDCDWETCSQAKPEPAQVQSSQILAIMSFCEQGT